MKAVRQQGNNKMNAASVPVLDTSDAAFELTSLENTGPKNEGELPTVAPPQPKGNSTADAETSSAAVSSGGYCSRLSWRISSSPWSYFMQLRREFGSSLLLLLVSNYMLIKGGSDPISHAASIPLFREYLHLPAEQHNIASAVILVPWSLKGVVGACSDLWAFGGYRKRSYMVLAAALGVFGAALLVVCGSHLTMGIAVAGIFMIRVQASFNDLLCEEIYLPRMAEKPHTGAALTSFIWLCLAVGAFFSALWAGPVIDHLPFQAVLAPILPLCVQQLFLLLWPWPFRSWSKSPGLVRETYVDAGGRYKPQLLAEHGRVFICAVCLTVCASGSVAAGFLSDSRHIVGAVYWLCSGLFMIVTIFLTMPRYMAKPVIYMFLRRMLIPSIGSQISYWMRAGPDCVADGPNFSWTFLLTWKGIASSFFAFAGAALFQRYISRWTFRRAFLVTSSLHQLTCIFDIVMVKRWNRKMGIPDKVWYFCSASIIEEVISMWQAMPGNVLMSRLCPKNLEGTVYAVVAGVNSFAMSTSKFSGNFLAYTVLGIRTLPTAESSCDFTNLPLAIGLVSGVLPLVPIALTFCLVPNVHMDEPIIKPEAKQQPAAAKAGVAVGADSDEHSSREVSPTMWDC